MTIGELVYKITGDAKQLKEELKKSDTQTKGLSKTFKTLATVIKGAFAGAALKAVFAFGKKLVDIYAVQEQAETALKGAIAATGKQAEISLDAMKDYASSLQQVTVFGDEAILSGQALLQSLADLDQRGLQVVTPAILDFAQATGMDLQGAMSLVGKTIGSSTNALARYGIEIDSSATKEEKLAQITEELESKFGGMAEAAGDTATGDIQQLSNTIGDFQEALGQAVTVAINPFVTALNDMVGNLTEAINKTAQLQESMNEYRETGKVVGDLASLEEQLAFAREKIITQPYNLALLEQITALEKAIRAEQEHLKWAAYEEYVKGQQTAATEENTTAVEENTDATEKAVDEQEELADRSSQIWLENYKNRADAMAKLNQLIEDSAKKEAELQTMKLEAAAGFFGGFAELAGAFANESIEMFNISKGIAAVEAGINSYLAFTQALADPLVPAFLKPVVAAGILASGLAQQVKILGAEPPAFANGGIVPQQPGLSSTGDQHLARVNPGEVILNEAQQKNLLGSMGGTNVNVNVNPRALRDWIQVQINNGQINTAGRR